MWAISLLILISCCGWLVLAIIRLMSSVLKAGIQRGGLSGNQALVPRWYFSLNSSEGFKKNCSKKQCVSTEWLLYRPMVGMDSQRAKSELTYDVLSGSVSLSPINDGSMYLTLHLSATFFRLGSTNCTFRVIISRSLKSL